MNIIENENSEDKKYCQNMDHSAQSCPVHQVNNTPKDKKIINKTFQQINPIPYNNNLPDRSLISNQNEIYFHNISSPQKFIQVDPKSSLEHQLEQLKLNYITLNNDNIIFREDINKLTDLNKQLERELNSERNRNYELANENDKLNNENRNLFQKIEGVNSKITEIKANSFNEKENANKQMYFEEKINQKEFEYKNLLDAKNQLNIDLNLLNDKYLKLKEKDDNDEKELQLIKNVQDEKINEIEKKLNLMINEMENLQKENLELKQQNQNYKNNIINATNEKNKYNSKYEEQKVKNEVLYKEIQNLKEQYQDIQRNVENNEEKKVVQEKVQKNKNDNKNQLLEELQKKIQNYKNERAKQQKNDEDF